MQHSLPRHEQRRVGLLRFIGEDSPPDSPAESLVSVVLAVAQGHLVANLTEAGHLRAIFARQGGPQLAPQRNGLLGFDKHSPATDVPTNAPGNAICRREVNREYFVKPEISPAFLGFVCQSIHGLPRDRSEEHTSE